MWLKQLRVLGVLGNSKLINRKEFRAAVGKFNVDPIMHPRVDGSDLPSYFDKDPYHYDIETFEFMCERTSLRVQYIGWCNHPRDQRMLVFTKTKSNK